MNAYTVVYDGCCNLCVTLIQALEALDQGHTFRYLPMQDEIALRRWQVTPSSCELGMILIRQEDNQRWQGSRAAEEIARVLTQGGLFLALYQQSGLQSLGDFCYTQVRDHRYDWFGQRPVYWSRYPVETLLPEPARAKASQSPPPASTQST